MTEYSPFIWKGKELKTYGDIRKACVALRSRQEGREFFDAYLAITIHAAANIGYLAGYCDPATMRRIHEYTGTSHPIFGTNEVSPETAFDVGMRQGKESNAHDHE